MIFRITLFVILFLNLGLHAQNGTSFSNSWEEIKNSDSLTIDQKKLWLEGYLFDNKKLKKQELTSSIYHYFLKEFNKIKAFDKAIECSLKIQKIGQHNFNFNSDFYNKNVRNLILLYNKNEDYFNAISSSKKFIKNHSKNTITLGKIYRLSGKSYFEIGDFEKAILYYKNAIYLFKELKNIKEEGKTLINLLEVYAKLEDKKYKSDFDKSLHIIDSINTLSNLKHNDITASLINAGVFYDFLNNYSKSKQYYNKALHLSQEKLDSLNIFKAFNNLGVISTKEDSLEQSKKNLKKALLYTVDDKEGKASVFNNLADVFKKENNHLKALEFYNKAISEIAITSNKLNIKDIDNSTNKIDLLAYLIDKADILLLLYEKTNYKRNLEEALTIYELSDKIIDIIYFESREDLSKLFWREQAENFYLKATQAAFKLNDSKKAFYFIEKSKALLLLENIIESNAKTLANIPIALIEREFNLKKEINKAEILFSDNIKNTDHILESIKNQIFIKKKNYSNFIDSLEVVSPKYYNYKKKITVFNASMTQKKLKKNEIILHYKFTSDNGYLVLLSKTFIKVYKLKDIEQIHKNLDVFKTAINKPFVSKKDSQHFKNISNAIYHQLLPFIKDDDNKLLNKKLIIIPDGLLQQVPFEALIVDKTKPLNKAYLLNFCDVSYAYSFSLLANTSKNEQKFNEDFFAISPSKFNDKSLSSLNITNSEVDRMEKLFSTKLVTNNNATKETFLSNYGKYKVIHISTHGGLVNNVPWIAFNDKKLILNDMLFKNQQADLVVLSACKTSQGEYKKGEGIMSIARAFSNSGAKSVISSLWDINQKSSDKIILEFYKNLKKGQSKSQALKVAKLNYISANNNTSEASPYYWSGIILLGDKSAILKTDNKFIYLTVIAFFVLLSLIINSLYVKAPNVKN